MNRFLSWQGVVVIGRAMFNQEREHGGDCHRVTGDTISILNNGKEMDYGCN